MEGWIKLHRGLQNHWLWDDKPFSKGQAWVDMLMLANHQDNKFLLGNELVTVERGSFITSELKLMERWGWSKTKVRAFLQLLQNDKMIVKKTDRKKTTITIDKYRDWQDSQTTEKPQKNHEETTKKPQKDTNKNVKNDKNVKKEYSQSEIDLLDYWNSKKIIKHKQDKKELHKTITKALKEYDLDTIKKAIDRYRTMLDDKTYFFDYKWGLDTFLSQKNCLPHFLDDGEKYLAYRDKQEKNSNQVDDSVWGDLKVDV